MGVLFIGAHLDDGLETLFDSADYEFDNLALWSVTGPVVTHDVQDETRVVRLGEPVTISASLPVGDLRIRGGFSEEETLQNFTLTRAAVIGVHFATPMAANEIVTTVTKPLQQLLTFACDTPCHFRRLTLRSASLQRPDAPEGALPPSIGCLYRGKTAHKEDQDPAYMLLPLHEINDSASAVVSRWFETWAKVGPALDLWMGTQLGPYTYLETRFLMLAQALEVYGRLRFPDQQKQRGDHKARRKRVTSLVTDPADKAWLKEALHYYHEPTYAERLDALVSYTELGYHGILRPDFCQVVKDTRNYFTHYDERSKRKAATDATELYQLSEQAVVLLQACLLRDLGFDEARSWSCLGRTHRVRALTQTNSYPVWNPTPPWA